TYELDPLMSERKRYNNIIEGIKTDHRGDGGDHARSSCGPNSSRPTLYAQSAVTSDSANEQSKEKTFQNAGDDVADEQSIANKIEEIHESDAEISARDEATGEDRRHIRNSRQTWHQKEKCKQARCDEKS